METAIAKKVTYAEFWDMEIPDGDTSLYELIHGEIVKRASPNCSHQIILSNILVLLGNHAHLNKSGQLFSAPLDVVLDEENALLPDIMFISKERDFIIDPKNGITGAPDLIVEILSKSTAKYDKGDKKDLYERFFVKEYWIVDLKNASIEVYSLMDGRYKLVSFATGEGKINSTVLAGFELEVSEVF